MAWLEMTKRKHSTVNYSYTGLGYTGILTYLGYTGILTYLGYAGILTYLGYTGILTYQTENFSPSETAHSMFCTVWYSDIPDSKS